MTALPQSRTEALLTQALAAYDIHTEREVRLEAIDQADGAVAAKLKHGDGGIETVVAPILFAADGARSVVREQLKLGFPGSSFPEPWKLVDVTFEAPVDAPEVYVDLCPHGLVFAMMFTPDHWRFISSTGDPMGLLPKGARVKKVLWSSDFHISHRIVERMTVGRICLGGDAAHLHSPLGARGMNLGVEDAYVFAELAAEALQGKGVGRLADYGRLRRQADKGVVRRVELMTRIARGEGAWSLVRGVAPRIAAALSPLRSLMMHTAVGLDHPVRLS